MSAEVWASPASHLDRYGSRRPSEARVAKIGIASDEPCCLSDKAMSASLGWSTLRMARSMCQEWQMGGGREIAAKDGSEPCLNGGSLHVVVKLGAIL